MSRLLAVLVSAALAMPAAAQHSEAGRFVAGMVRMMAGGDRHAMRQSVLRFADVPGLARSAVGRHWERMSEAQRARYIDLYETYVVTALARQAARGEADVIFVEERVIGERQTLVGARVTPPGGRSRLVHWRVREVEGRMSIVDVLDEGVSLASVHRADLTGWLNAHNGDIEGFLTMLAERARRGG